MRRIADNEEYRMPATIEDPLVLDEIRQSMQGIGYAQGK
jgi:propionyl-CoA synthetase